MLKVEDVTFAYGPRVAVDKVSLEVRQGEIVGIIGPNGSGKSTLLRVVCGLLRPQMGRISIAGHDINELSRSEIARLIAMVPQNPHMPESFGAAEVVLLGRTPHLRLLQAERARDYAVAQEAMAACGAWELGSRCIGELSGGERQRVVIARALAQEPTLLLLDEPTSQLDVSHQMAVLNLITDLTRDRRLAVVVVFHDLNLAAQYCQRLVVLKAGKIVAQGTPREVITVENLAAAYGAEVCVVTHPKNNLPVALITGNNGRSKGVSN